MVEKVIGCPNGVLVKKREIAELQAALTTAIEAVRGFIESEAPHGRERTKTEMVEYYKLSWQMARWQRLQAALTKAHGKVRS